MADIDTSVVYLSFFTFCLRVLFSLIVKNINISNSAANVKGASLKVIHKYGPCSQLHRDDGDHTKSIVRQDQARVDWINSRLFKKSVPAATAASNGTRYEQDATTLPAKPGQVLGTGNYIVTVGLGTPKEDLSLAFDTGSDLTWTQCQPCAKSCYDQSEAIFDPSKSTSYSNVSCASTDCSQLKSDPGNNQTSLSCAFIEVKFCTTFCMSHASNYTSIIRVTIISCNYVYATLRYY